VPSLVVVGDQDEPCLEPSLFMRRHIPHAGLVMLPMTGHTANIEEPALCNLHVSEFLAAVENGRWGPWKAEKPGRR
jgi:pimeloyl-ACP methyl ester carboxylesterase